MRHKQEYSYKLTEEIARWAFEVRINNESRDWDIVFTNPTAGPWKRIMASNEDGIKGEVYRFDREEDRPDLILVNDDLKIVTIIEAKDSLEKLVTDGQIIKSANVVNNLSNKLHNLRNHKYWGNRNTYVYIAGLLWGAESKSTVKMRESAFGKYIELIDTDKSYICDIVFGIEAHKSETNQSIVCEGFISPNTIIYKELKSNQFIKSMPIDYLK